MSVSDLSLALAGSTEISILVKATILLGAGLAAARLAGRSRASIRHLLLAATLTAALALPILVLEAPRLLIAVPSTAAQVSPMRAATSPAGSPAGIAGDAAAVAAPGAESRWLPALPSILRICWAAGAGLLLIGVGVDFWRLRRIRRTSLPCLGWNRLTQALACERGLSRNIEIGWHEGVAAPITLGFRRPAVILPADARKWPEADLRRALVHEIEHIARGDWMVQLLARVACALYWFHPLAWAAWRRLCLEAERACDDAVLTTAEADAYARQLVELARRMARTPAPLALGMARRSDLSARVGALLDAKTRRGRAGAWAAGWALSAAVLLAGAVAPFRAIALPAAAGVPEEGQTGSSALLEAAARGDLATIESLLNAGANVNSVVQGDGTPLIEAARAGRLAAVRTLLDRGADPNLGVAGDGNPLIMAAREGHTEIVTLLLDRGAIIDRIVPEDENALIQASAHGRLETVRLLIARGANVNQGAMGSGEWRTPLRMARRGGHTEVVAALLVAGARE
jgi:beta-lactamase regulating signal transducer with metallopeptidase domain